MAYKPGNRLESMLPVTFEQDKWRLLFQAVPPPDFRQLGVGQHRPESRRGTTLNSRACHMCDHLSCNERKKQSERLKSLHTVWCDHCTQCGVILTSAMGGCFQPGPTVAGAGHCASVRVCGVWMLLGTVMAP